MLLVGAPLFETKQMQALLVSVTLKVLFMEGLRAPEMDPAYV